MDHGTLPTTGIGVIQQPGHLWRHLDVIWVYQLIGEAIGEAGLIIIEEYINRRKNTVAQYIVNRLIHKT